MGPITLSEAMITAHGAGLTVQLLVGVQQGRSELLLALRSGDSDSELHLLNGSGFRRDEVPLERRSQSGPERWDYPLSLPTLQERYILRISSGARARDLPLLPAAQALIHAHGWVADAASRLAEPLISSSDFRRALGEFEVTHAD